MYPVLTSSRLLSDLSGIWSFKLDCGKGFEEEWFQKSLENPMTVPVPAAYNDLKEGIDFRDHYGWMFYRRTFSAPESTRAQRVMLRFGAVAHGAKVYMNGNLPYVRGGGFLPPEMEITDLAGRGGRLLTIVVNGIIDYATLPVGGKNNILSRELSGFETKGPQRPVSNPNFDLSNYCGIIRSIGTYTTPKSCIGDITVAAEVNGTDVALNYKIDIIGTGECLVKVFGREGNKVTEAAGREGILKIEQVKL